MAVITVQNRLGEIRDLPLEVNRSLMQMLRDAGYDEILALCGGQRSCATCHVYVDEPHFALLPAMTEEENDVLDGSDHRRPTSRLCCQIRSSPDLDGMQVTIAPEE